MPGDKKLTQDRIEIEKKGDIKIDEARGKCANSLIAESGAHQCLL